jgi:DNA-directed RNA polymerase specialized sigma24 family protein
MDDIITDTVYRVWQRLKRDPNEIASNETVLAYAVKVARRMIARCWETEQCHPCQPLPLDLPSPDLALRNLESAEFLDRLTSHLSHDDAELFRAKFVEGLSDTEIARSVTFPQGAALRKRLSRLRKRLQRAVADFLADRAPAAGVRSSSPSNPTPRSGHS